MILSDALVQEIFFVLNASGAASVTVAKLQAEVSHQPPPLPPPTLPNAAPAENK